MKVNSQCTRQMTLHTPGAKDHRVRAALSTETPVRRVFGDEVLEHSEGAIDMSRAEGGLPLLVNHDNQALPIGRVENIALGNDRKLRGELVFSESTQAARDAWSLVEDGTLTDVSISYRILDYEAGRSGDDTFLVTRWQPYEVSCVSCPADGAAGIGRTLDPDEASLMDANDKASDEGARSFEDGQRAERERLNAIDGASAVLIRMAPNAHEELKALATKARAANTSADKFRTDALELVHRHQESLGDEDRRELDGPNIGSDGRRPMMTPGRTQGEKESRAMATALEKRVLPHKVKDEDVQGNPYVQWRVLDFAEHCLRAAGIDTRGKSAEQIAKMALQQRAISPGTAAYDTTDFTSMTENLGYKALFDGFASAERSWDTWCAVGSVPDFKQFGVPRISATSLLPTVAENAAYTNLTRVDEGEHGQAVKYGGLISYSWEAVVNNDLTSFADQAASCGEAAQATIDTEVYTLLLANPAMGDTVTLFHATHGNSGTAALDLAGLIATRVAMGRQTDGNSRDLGIRLAHLLVPLELQDTADDLANSEWLVDSGGSAQRINTVRNTFTVIPTHQLTDINNWYGLARRGQTFKVFFLNGQQAPSIEQETGWDTDAVHWKVRSVFDVVPQDWRGMYLNAVT